MSDILAVIEKLENMRFIAPASAEDIAKAEKELGVTFAKDYKAYVQKYGAISAKGIELTGVIEAKRLDVVRVTKEERDFNPKLPANMYVIGNIGIDGIVALQDAAGAVYTIAPNEAPKLYCASLAEYLEKVSF